MIQLQNAVNRFGKLILNDLKEAGIKCWIAGGSLRDYFSDVHKETDFDIFFPNQEMFDRTSRWFENKNADFTFEGENGVKVEFEGKKFDLVKKFFESPQHTIDAFDFTVSMFAVDSNKVYYGESSFIDLAKKQLMFNQITYPVSTLKRSFRYYQKGFQMCDGEMRKLTEALFTEGLKHVTFQLPKKESTEDNTENEESSGDSFFNGID